MFSLLPGDYMTAFLLIIIRGYFNFLKESGALSEGSGFIRLCSLKAFLATHTGPPELLPFYDK